MIPRLYWRPCDDGERYLGPFGGGWAGPVAPPGRCVLRRARCHARKERGE